MRKLLKRWLGWDASSGTFDFDDIERAQPRSATARVRTNRPQVRSTKRTVGSARDSASEADFDPYNTGKFDRSVSWERISHTQR